RQERDTRLFERALEGGPPTQLMRMPGNVYPREVSPDGKELLYVSSKWSLYAIRLDSPSGTARPKLLVETQESILTAHFSPDGRWIVYTAGSGDKSEIYVQPYAFGGIRKQISAAGGRSPVWRGDGKEIVYWFGTKLYSVRVQITGNEIRTSVPE